MLSSKVVDPAGANNMTGVATVMSLVMETQMFDSNEMSFEIQWTGTPTGTIVFEGSSQYDPISNPGATFVTISNASLLNPVAPTIAGSPGSYIGAFFKPAMAKWVRWRYVNTSGTGQLSIWAFGKGRN
jgi:hypothetical protein